MLKNFVTDTMLKSYYPTIASYLPPTYSDFSVPILEAFNLLQDELIAKGYEPRKLMIPLDALRLMTETAVQNVLTPLTATAAVTKLHIDGVAGFRRCVITPTVCTGSVVINWEGSNDQDCDDDTEPTSWALIKAFTFTSAVAQSFVTVDEYKYYRIKVVSVGTTITFTAGIYETYCDRWIMWKAFQMIFASMSKDPDDVWAQRANYAQTNFETALNAYKVMIDEDDDNLVDPDQEKTTTDTRFTL